MLNEVKHLLLIRRFYPLALATETFKNRPPKEASMSDQEKLAHRLALLDEVELSADDLKFISAEIEDLDRVVAELETFAQDTPWISQQSQPAGKKV